MRFLVRATLLAAAIALATAVLAWWAVPLVGAVWGWLDRRGRRPAATAALAGAVAWAMLLARDAGRGPVGAFARTLAGVMHVPGWALLLLTLGYAAALASAAAAVTREVGATAR